VKRTGHPGPGARTAHELYNQTLADYSGWASAVSEKMITTFCLERAGVCYVWTDSNVCR